MSKIDKCIEAESVLVIARDQWVGIWGDWQWIWAFVFRLMKIFWSYFVMMVAQLWIYQKKKKKTHWTKHYKWSDFMVCALHLNKAIFFKKENFYMSQQQIYLPPSICINLFCLLPFKMNELYLFLSKMNTLHLYAEFHSPPLFSSFTIDR